MTRFAALLALLALPNCTSTGDTTVRKGGTESMFTDSACGRWCQRGVDLGCGTPSDCEVNCFDNRESYQMMSGQTCTNAMDALLDCIADDDAAYCDEAAANAACETQNKALTDSCAFACEETDDSTCSSCVAHYCCNERDRCDDSCQAAVQTYASCSSGETTCRSQAAKTSPAAGAYLDCAVQSCAEVCQ